MKVSVSNRSFVLHQTHKVTYQVKFGQLLNEDCCPLPNILFRRSPSSVEAMFTVVTLEQVKSPQQVVLLNEWVSVMDD